MTSCIPKSCSEIKIPKVEYLTFLTVGILLHRQEIVVQIAYLGSKSQEKVRIPPGLCANAPLGDRAVQVNVD